MKLSLKPNERDRAIAAGILKPPTLALVPPAQDPQPGLPDQRQTAAAAMPAPTPAPPRSTRSRPPAQPTRYERCMTALAAALPGAVLRPPFAIGTRQALDAWPGRTVAPDALKKTIKTLVLTNRYTRSLTLPGAVRTALDGSTEPVSAEHQAQALADLASRGQSR